MGINLLLLSQEKLYIWTYVRILWVQLSFLKINIHTCYIRHISCSSRTCFYCCVIFSRDPVKRIDVQYHARIKLIFPVSRDIVTVRAWNKNLIRYQLLKNNETFVKVYASKFRAVLKHKLHQKDTNLASILLIISFGGIDFLQLLILLH